MAKPILDATIVAREDFNDTLSIFRLEPFSNPVLFFGTLSALAVHVTALYTPFLQSLLDVRPVAFEDLVVLVGLAALILVVMEIHKAWRWRHPIS